MAPRKTATAKRTARRTTRSTSSSPGKPKAITHLSARVKKINAMIFADPGAGKTLLAGTSGPNTLILNADGPDGPESIRAAGLKVDVWDIEGGKDLDEAYKFARSSANEYDWIWLDSATLFQELGMDELMDAVVEAKPHRNEFIPDVKEYLENQNRLAKWVRHMKAIPTFHFGITAHVMRMEDEDGELKMYLPAIQGGKGLLSSKMCGYMGIVGHLEVEERRVKGGSAREKEEIRVLHTKRSGYYYGKDRFHVTGGRVVEPNMAQITDLVMSKQGTRKSSAKRTTRSRRSA